MERAVWKAISDALHEVGNGDVCEGLAWLTETDELRVALAAIHAVQMHMIDNQK